MAGSDVIDDTYYNTSKIDMNYLSINTIHCYQYVVIMIINK